MKKREGERRSEGGGASWQAGSVKWMKRGKTKRQTAKDGIRSNQGISRYIHVYILFPLPPPTRFLLIYFVACNPIPTPRFLRFLLTPVTVPHPFAFSLFPSLTPSYSLFMFVPFL